jgi:MSHA pilin protein MshC
VPDRGFSLAELIAVILVVSVLSVFAVTRFSGNIAVTRGFYDELLAQVQYARKVAIAQRRSVFVRITPGAQSELCYNAAGPCAGVVSPTGGVPFSLAVPTGVNVAAATIQFDGLGRYPAGGPLDVTVSGDGSYQFTVFHETGYVRGP